MTVTVYRSDDASAPTLNANVGSLIALLDACLVNGYGSKAAAGWTKPFSDTNKAAYLNGSGSTNTYLRVDNTIAAAGYARVVAYESMSGIDTGTNACPTSAQMSGGGYIHTSSSTDAINRPWILIADSKRFYLWVGVFMTTGVALSTSNRESSMFFAGDLISYKPGDTGHFTVVLGFGTSYSQNSSGGSSAYNSTLSGHYTMRPASLAVGAVPVGKGDDSNASTVPYMGSSSVAIAYPDPVTGSFRLSRVYCSNGTATVAVRGHFPGFWSPLNKLVGQNGDTFSGSGALAGRTFILLDTMHSSVRCRAALETSDTWD